MGLEKEVMKCVVLLIVLIASIASVPIVENAPTTTTMSPESRDEKMARYRLPNDTIPRLYNIFIEPNMNDEVFSWAGKISIDIEVVDPTPVITLHAYKNLIIYENFTELVDINGTKLAPVKHNRDDEVEFLRLLFDQEIPVGNYSLRLKYNGTDTLEWVGFYNASYVLADWEPRYGQVVGTHFEATTARRAFPCWDEPSLKARFHVSIKHFPNYTAISNMPESEHLDTPDGKILTVFDTTPIMSTYHLTFVISNYENIVNEHGNVSLHTSKSAMDEVTHVMDFSTKVAEVMEAYTGLPHGFPRLGSVTLPHYTSAATEHWGLVTYSEQRITRDVNKTTIAENDRIDMLIAHELAHSWFGNRVTPRWWDDLWLNEAFATYFQYYIVDQIHENWRGLDLFIVHNNQEMAFTLDLDGKIPVKWTPITNEEIRCVFGRLTYKKGAAIVHMFRNILGDNVFRAGIQKYMAKHSFLVVDSDDLMTAFQEAYDAESITERPLNVKETMTSWVTQEGHPLINVTRNYTTGDTEVSQISALGSGASEKWWIPLTYATKSSLNFSSTLPVSWINDKQRSVNISGIDKNDWIVFNIQASGYYRVNYDKENWNRLAQYLNTDGYENIHVLNRASLINDAFYLALRQPEDYLRIFYELTKYLAREVEYLPWRSAHTAFESIEIMLRGSDLHDIFVKHVLRLMHSFVEKVGFEPKDNDDHFTKLARSDVIKWACKLGHIRCLEYASQKLIKLQENPLENRLHPADSQWIFCAGLKGLNDTAAQQIFNWVNGTEETLFIASVGCTENHQLHRNILNATLEQDYTLKKHNAYRAFAELLESTDENFNFAVEFFLENHRAMNNSDIGHDERRCTYAGADLVFQIFCEVTSRARLEKVKQILLLDAVKNNPDVPKMIKWSERKIARDAVEIAPFLKLWDELSTENAINGSQIDPR